MKKLLGILLIIFWMITPLSAAESPFPAATVYLVGQIEAKDLRIAVFNEEGMELSSEDALLSFEFPNLEEWEVSQSLYFKYSSNLPYQSAGRLIFEVGNLALDEVNTLSTNLELTSESLMTRVENGNAFNTTFLPGAQSEVPIGKLTVRLNKRADDVFTAGTYAGSFTINYTEGS